MYNDDPTARFRNNIFVGVSVGDGDNPPVLQAAFEAAYEKARDGGGEPPYRVLEIWVNGENPLTEYIVALKAGH
jgi:hypothetical protein